MLDIIIDTIIDSLKLIPFLFVAFLIIEFFEHKLSHKSIKKLQKTKKLGPLFGSLLGAIPQCGFSVLATNLYITRIISLGTLIAIYLSTSDEMLPLLIAEKADISIILNIIIIKIIIGMLFGFIIDLIIPKKQTENYEICDHDHCDCSHSLVISSIKHTLKTTLFIFITTFILNLTIHYIGEDTIKNIFNQNNFFTPFIAALIGLIPNCASSIIITELYLSNILKLSSALAGLLSGSGVGLLVLLKSNDNIKESLKIIAILYLISVFVGITLELFGI